ncbi:hypothetical protein AAF712_009762 [Marasmius tenuissimus]|uniref:Indoleamine 2,3-dioxygenase n=1 Tax=Marasmius tenuissimus TaxID=585030 RepID=A0ABR2ZQF9_9AGAR
MQPEIGHYSESAFDVDPKTGFMASRVPLGRLPASWELWEALLDSAINEKLQPGDIIGLPEEDAARSARWRERVRQVHPGSPHRRPQHLPHPPPPSPPRPNLPPPLLHPNPAPNIPHPNPQTHLHPHPQSMPPNRYAPRNNLCRHSPLQLEPHHPDPIDDDFPPKPNNLRSQTLFTGLPDEEAFYLSSARIELRGVEALEIMRMTTDEISVGDTLAVGRITNLLTTLTTVIARPPKAPLGHVYYNSVRPWFRGQDSDTHKRKWVFEGLSDLEREGEGISEPRELSGASAGQSSLVHALDCFLGVENVKTTTGEGKPSFMSRMQVYMPRNHRLFLDHLAKTERPLRGFVQESEDGELVGAFNKAVMALKEFRDSHMIIVTLYIIGPARRARQSEEDEKRRKEWKEERLKGTGGTDLVKFLKTTRTQTAETVLETCNVTTN